MSTQRVREICTDALPNICGWPGCYTHVARGKKYCDVCAEKANQKRARDKERIALRRKLAKGQT